MEFEFGNREAPVLILTDSAVDTFSKDSAKDPALHRNGRLYNGLIVPIKYYLNQYLILNSPLRLISETVGQEPFHYASVVESERDKKKPPNPVNLRSILLAVNPVLVLTLGDFAFSSCQVALGHDSEIRHFSSADLGDIYRQNMIKLRMSDNEGQAILPLLGCDYLKEPRTGDAFIGPEDPALFLSYFHYLGCTLGRLFLDLYAKKQYRWSKSICDSKMPLAR